MTKEYARKAAKEKLIHFFAHDTGRQALLDQFRNFLKTCSSFTGRFLASYPISGELDILKLLTGEKRDVFLPVTIDDTRIEFFQYSKNGELIVDLKPGKYGIMEPETKYAYSIRPDDIIIVPCLGVNKNGYRLGRGKGYYDRQYNWIQNLNRLAVLPDCVIDLDFQHEMHDLRLNTIVTEERIVEVRDYG